MIKELSLLFGSVFIACYLAFAFVNWDIVWVAHVDTFMRAIFVLFNAAMDCTATFVYLEGKDKH